MEAQTSIAPALPVAPSPREKTPWLFLLLVAAIPSVIAVSQLGRIHPDELYQTLEPALFRARGYGVLAWEWHSGIRNWAVPIFFSWLLKACDALGIESPRSYRAVLELPQYALHVWMLVAVFRYARRRVELPCALLAVALVGLCGWVLIFAGRTMGESFSAAFLMIAIEALDREPSRGAALEAGVVLGLAVVVRYGSAVFVLAALTWLLARKDWPRLAYTCIGGGAVALALGALDWATWKQPFHSLIAYFEFNVLSGESAAQFGAEPGWYFAPVLLANLPLWTWPGLWRGVKAERPRLPLAVFGSLVYVAVISATAHKEERFIYPALVLCVSAAAPVVGQWVLRRSSVGARVAAALLVFALGAAPYLWQAGIAGPEEWKKDMRGDQFRAIVDATRSPDAHGLLIIGDGIWGVGGFFYIGKNIPWLTVDFSRDPRFQMAMNDRRINRAVTIDGHEHEALEGRGFRAVKQIGRETIFERP